MTQYAYCRRHKRSTLALLWVSVAAWPGLQVHGEDNLTTFQVHGFASQAIMTTTDNNVFGSTDDNASLGFTELGINASLRPLPKLQLAAQLLSRRAGEGNDGDIEVDYALLDYSLLASPTDHFGVRAGRFKIPLGLYNDTRDVPFTRPSILLPQSIYWDTTRRTALSADGIELYAEHHTERGDFILEIGAGEPRPDLDLELVVFGQDFPGELDSDLSFVGRLRYERDGGRLRLALTGVQSKTPYDPDLPAPLDLPAGDVTLTFGILSFQYNQEHWSVTAEYSRRFLEFSGFEPLLPDRTFPADAYYLQGTYRFADDWEFVVRYDALFLDIHDRDGDDFAREFGGPEHRRFAKDWTIGLRWNVTPSFMIRAEYHDVDGTAWLPLQDNPDAFQTEQHWSLFALQASYRF